MNIPQAIRDLRRENSPVQWIGTGGGFDFLWRNFGRFELVISARDYDLFDDDDNGETPAIVTRYDKGAETPDNEAGDWMNPVSVFEGTAREAVAFVEAYETK